jgi:hypothetical protein
LMGANFLANEEAIKRVRRACLDSPDETMQKFRDVDFADNFFADWRTIVGTFEALTKLVTALSVSHSCSISQVLPAILSLRQHLSGPAQGSRRAADVHRGTLTSLTKYFGDVLKLYDEQSLAGANDYVVLATALSPQTLLLLQNDSTREMTTTIHINARFRLDVVYAKLFPDDYKVLHAETVKDNGRWDVGQSPLANEWHVYTRHKPLRIGLTEETDGFQWWVSMKPTLPRLFKLARAVLCIAATSTPVERMWNKTKRVFNKLRGRLHPEMGGKQVFVRDMWDWLKSGGEAILQEHTQARDAQ